MKHFICLSFLPLLGIAQEAKNSETVIIDPAKGSSSSIMAAPANDNCANAISLTVGGALTCNQVAGEATAQAGECLANYAGGGNSTMWYKFQASNDSLVLNLVQTTTGNPVLKVYGPFAPGAGCLPACSSAIYNSQLAGDPGVHLLLTGLSTATNNNQYWVQIDAIDPNGPSMTGLQFCINVVNPASNAYAGSANQINACGTSFSGTSNGGYWSNGTSTGFNNFDNNNGTTCSTCSEVGDDSPFVINNVSWFQFCSGTAGTWQVTVNGISGCTLASPNQGIQASVFTGNTTALSNQGNSQSPIPPGGSWTSPVITVNAGACAWLMIDGFAGDACNYNVTLTNITGGCIVLPVEISGFSGRTINGQNILEWQTLSERNNNFFNVEKSTDGINWASIQTISGTNTRHQNQYRVIDNMVSPVINYYRLKQTDYDGSYSYFKTIVIDNSNLFINTVIQVIDVLGNNYGTVVPASPGIYFKKYHNGACEKVIIPQ